MFDYLRLCFLLGRLLSVRARTATLVSVYGQSGKQVYKEGETSESSHIDTPWLLLEIVRHTDISQ